MNGEGEGPEAPLDALIDDRPARGLVERIRRSIQRRALTGHVATLSWSTTWIVVLEYLSAMFTVLGTTDAGVTDRNDDGPGEGPGRTA